jgi:UDP-GlcNAc:undecaprenyl-phosphate/decaprenyl-phosphate GlcNAc-1-phosphate transferase
VSAVFYLGVFVLSLLLSFVFTRYVRNLSMGLGWVAPPLQERDLHQGPLPRLGGVAIFLSFLVSVAAVLLVRRHFPALSSGVSFRILLGILLPGTLIFLLGVYDDIYTVGPYFKFGIQAVAGTLLFVGGFRILELPVLFGHHHFSWAIGLPITVLWVVGITNAFNLIDGLDGLAAGSALFSTLVVFVVAISNHSSLVSLLTIALAGAILGFLRFNFNPATIFLGDCGSLFIGFMLSALALQGAQQKSPTIVAVAIPVVSFGLPILDTTLSVLRRVINGKPVFSADREHIHHKLLQRGMSQRQVVIVLYAVSALFALLSLFLLWPTGSTLGLVLTVIGTGVWFGVQRLGYLEFGELRRVAQRTVEQRKIFVNNLAIRRATEELKSSNGYIHVCRILESAFAENDFDGFELTVKADEVERHHRSNERQHLGSGESLCFKWRKLESGDFHNYGAAWNLGLELVSSANRRHGSIRIYRFYSDRDLLVDTNLLISVFPVVLADALECALTLERVVQQGDVNTGFMAAEAG